MNLDLFSTLDPVLRSHVLAVLAILAAAEETDAEELRDVWEQVSGGGNDALFREVVLQLVRSPFVHLQPDGKLAVEQALFAGLQRHLMLAAPEAFMCAHRTLLQRREAYVESIPAMSCEARRVIPRLARHRMILNTAIERTSQEYARALVSGHASGCRAIADAVRSAHLLTAQQLGSEGSRVRDLLGMFGEACWASGIVRVPMVGNAVTKLLLSQTRRPETVCRALLGVQSFHDGDWYEAHRQLGFAMRRLPLPYSAVVSLSLAAVAQMRARVGSQDDAIAASERALRMASMIGDSHVSFRIQHSLAVVCAELSAPEPGYRVADRLLGGHRLQLARPPAELLRSAIQGARSPIGGPWEPHFVVMAQVARRGYREGDVRSVAEVVRDSLLRVVSGGRCDVRIMYNLLMLCHIFTAPKELLPMLLQAARLKRISGTIEGINLLDCLRDAVALNQCDRALQSEWVAVTKRGRGDLFYGTPLDGFSALLRVPFPCEPAEQGSLDKIGEALTHLTRYLDNYSFRRPTLRDMLDLTVAKFAHYRGLSMLLADTAIRDEWPRWALETLPELAVEVPAEFRQGRGGEYIVWYPYVEVLKCFGSLQATEARAKGDMVRIEVSPDLVPVIQAVQTAFNRVREGLPYPGHSAMVGLLTDALAELEGAAETGRAGGYRQARAAVLKYESLLPT